MGVSHLPNAHCRRLCSSLKTQNDNEKKNVYSVMHAYYFSRLGCSFWSCFHAKHPSLTVKCQDHVSVNRELNCTREMACNHLNDLAEELQAAGIMKNAFKIENGVWKGDIDTSRFVWYTVLCSIKVKCFPKRREGRIMMDLTLHTIWF